LHAKLIECADRKVEIASKWKKEQTGWQNDSIRFRLGTTRRL